MVSPWLILFAPLFACIGIVLFGRKSTVISAGLAITGMLSSFIMLVINGLSGLGGHGGHGGHGEHHASGLHFSLDWIDLPGLAIEFGLLLNEPALLMGLVVTGVGSLIFIYSTGYMKGEPGFSRYFTCLSLFAFSMMGIVLADNFITLFIFWELVGASSYLLIGHWYHKPEAAAANKKAFLANRIADFGLLIGIMLLWALSGTEGAARTLNYEELAHRLPHMLEAGVVQTGTIGIIGAFIFCGVLGKSAQFPLHVWLPDAMQGPTPVSALIHAATMVAAGVYLVARTFFMFSLSPDLLNMVAWIGGFTAIFAASMALVERDIKRILAFSTLSQLGYMVMCLGLSGVIAGVYHLTTHAFFKALLFLGAGSVIHALHTNDIWKMGGMLKKMPITGWTFLVGTFALCGIYPLSGFWSKDEILTVAYHNSGALYIIASIVAGMTAFYMGRLIFVVFFGKPRSEAVEHAHEFPPVMTVPLLILAVLSVIAGFLHIPDFLHHAHVGGVHPKFNMSVAISSSLIAFIGLGLAYIIYLKEWRPGKAILDALETPHRILTNKYYIDELYAWINNNVQQRMARYLSRFEDIVICGIWAKGIAKTTKLSAYLLRTAQTGKVQHYALVFVVGLVFVLFFAQAGGF